MTANRYRLETNWRPSSEYDYLRRPLTTAERVSRHRARARGEATHMRRPGRRPPDTILTIPANPGVDRDYPLDFLTPVRHVTDEVTRAGHRGATLDDMVRTYQHSLPSDLARVKLIHGLRNDDDAKRFLLDRAISALGATLRPPTRGYGWRLATTPAASQAQDGGPASQPAQPA